MTLSFSAHVMAVDRVERRLRAVTAAIDAARIPYAVASGNAVAAWVGRIDPATTRATRDVDLLIDDSIAASIPETLRSRLDQVRDSMDEAD